MDDDATILPFSGSQYYAGAGDPRPQFEIRENNLSTVEACALCGVLDRIRIGPLLSLQDGWQPVCDSCAASRATPALWARLELARAVAQLPRTSAEAEAFRWDGVPRDKSAILAHYARHAPKRFCQYDGWTPDVGGFDPVTDPDDTGYGATSGETWELMTGAPVRVLITPGTAPADVLAALDAIRALIARDGLELAPNPELDAPLWVFAGTDLPGEVPPLA